MLRGRHTGGSKRREYISINTPHSLMTWGQMALSDELQDEDIEAVLGGRHSPVRGRVRGCSFLDTPACQVLRAVDYCGMYTRQLRQSLRHMKCASHHIRLQAMAFCPRLHTPTFARLQELP